MFRQKISFFLEKRQKNVAFLFGFLMEKRCVSIWILNGKALRFYLDSSKKGRGKVENAMQEGVFLSLCG